MDFSFYCPLDQEHEHVFFCGLMCVCIYSLCNMCVCNFRSLMFSKSIHVEHKNGPTWRKLWVGPAPGESVDCCFVPRPNPRGYVSCSCSALFRFGPLPHTRHHTTTKYTQPASKHHTSITSIIVAWATQKAGSTSSEFYKAFMLLTGWSCQSVKTTWKVEAMDSSGP